MFYYYEQNGCENFLICLLYTRFVLFPLCISLAVDFWVLW